MPVRVCTHCQRRTADGGDICPYCGESLPLNPPERSAAARGVAWGCYIGCAATIGAFFLFVARGCFHDPTPAERATSERLEVLVVCEKFAKQQLKAPSTASFDYGDVGQRYVARQQSDGTFQVKGWVDAENSFGAHLRSAYSCVVRHDGADQWQLVSLAIQ